MCSLQYWKRKPGTKWEYYSQTCRGAYYGVHDFHIIELTRAVCKEPTHTDNLTCPKMLDVNGLRRFGRCRHTHGKRISNDLFLLNAMIISVVGVMEIRCERTKMKNVLLNHAILNKSLTNLETTIIGYFQDRI